MTAEQSLSTKVIAPSSASLTSSHRLGSTAASPTQQETQEDPTEAAFNLKSPTFWLVVLSVYLSFFLIALDRMIIATAIPSITNTFDSISDIGWYGSAYMLTCAIFNPMFGSIYRLYPVKWVFIASVTVFEIGSALCGAAPTSIALIFGRAIAGAGAAGISSGAIMIVVNMVPLHKRPVFTSFFGMAFGVSSVIGPLVGGTFADNKHLTWRWCFYINLPIGGAAILAVLLFLRLPEEKPREKLSAFEQLKSLDPIGVGIFAPSMVCLNLALQWGGSSYAWSNPKVIALLVIFAITFVAFLVVEYKMPKTAMAPPRVVLNRSVASALFFTFMMSGGMMACIYYISIWFQVAQGQSAMQAGIRTIPIVFSLIIFGIVCAVVTQKIGYYVPALLVSAVMAATGAGLLSTLTPGSSSAAWIGYQILYGFGLGAGAQTANLAAQTVLPKEDVPLGLALGFFMQQLGGSVFLAIGQNIFSSDLVKQLSGNTGLDTTAIVNTGATDIKKIVPANMVDVVINAYSHSLTRVFLLAAGLSAAMIIGALCMEWRSIKKDQGKGVNEAGKEDEKA